MPAADATGLGPSPCGRYGLCKEHHSPVAAIGQDPSLGSEACEGVVTTPRRFWCLEKRVLTTHNKGIAVNEVSYPFQPHARVASDFVRGSARLWDRP